MTTLTVRYFAGARAASGVDHEAVELSDGATVADAVDALTGRHGERLAAVLAGCSFLLDAVAVRDRSIPVGTSAELDVLPPFAGG